jgi:3',5'-cyclic AMP phosphodiesterase CpdA
MLTSDQLLRMDLDAVLTVGDSQYEHGEAEGYRQAFDPSWGRVKWLIRPVPGNHEYESPGAIPYYDYFNGPGVRTGPAGDRVQGGYYSYDVGGWQVVGLNSECGEIPGGCGPDSPQVQWLRADLAAHPARCTLAYFHGPRFTSGRYGNESDNVKPFWDALYAAGADLVVSGHEHFYERFAPQNPDGVGDAARGIRQFTVGVGGKGAHSFITQAPNSEFRDNRTLGAVAFTLDEGRYQWRLVRAPNGATVDAGSGTCH